MNGERFDALTKTLKSATTRRRAVATIGLLAASGAVRRADAAQLAPATCAGEGAVCIMLTGCCAGYTCMTSAINPNLGVCQSGGTGGVEVQPPAASGSTTAQAAPGTPTTTTSSRRTHTPGDNKKTRDSYAIAVRLNCGVNTETVTVKNKGLYQVTLTQFASDAIPNATHTDNFMNNRVLAPGKQVTFYNGAYSADLPKDAERWFTDGIFSNPGDRLTVTTSGSVTKTATCGDTVNSTTVGSSHRKKRKRKKKR